MLLPVLCDEGKVMIDSHPEYGTPRSRTPTFALSLTKNSNYNQRNIKHIMNFLRDQVYETSSDALNRYALTVLFERNHHDSLKYCHSGICIDKLHSCKVQFLSPSSQDWSPQVTLSHLNGKDIITETKPFNLQPLLNTHKKNGNMYHHSLHRGKQHISTTKTRHKPILQLPTLRNHPSFTHTEIPSIEEMTRIDDDGIERPIRDNDKTNFFPKRFFSHEEYYSLLQVMVKLNSQAFIGSDPNPVTDALSNIFQSQWIKGFFNFIKVPESLAEMLHQVLEGNLMNGLLEPIVNKVLAGAKTLKRRRRRRLFAKSEKRKLVAKRRKFSKHDLQAMKRITKKLIKPLRQYAKHIIGKFDETLFESSDSRLLMNFKTHFEKVMPRTDKWRWQSRNPQVETKVKKPVSVKPSEEPPLPAPIVVKNTTEKGPCMGLKGPSSVAFCIKNAFSPLKLSNVTAEKETNKAYMEALESAQIAESLEAGKDLIIKKQPIAKIKKKEIKQTELRILENKVSAAMDEMNLLPTKHKISRSLPYLVFQRLQNRIRRRRRQINNGKLPEEVYPPAALSTSFIELFSRIKTGGCDIHESVKTCETAREMFEINGVNGPESGKCVWCTRRMGSAEEGRCAEEEHAADIEERATANGIHGVKCHAFQPHGLPPIDRISEENPPYVNALKKPSVQTETNAGMSWGAEVLTDTTVETTMMMIMGKIHEETAIGLQMTVNNTVFRTTNEMLTEEISNGLVESLSESLSALLSRSVLRTGTKEITADLVPTVTHILASSLTMSLTRSPKNDFYCHYCNTFKFYCTYCKQASRDDYEKDYYASYFAQYYSRYYAYFYVDVFAEGFAGESIIDGNMDRD
eukprot:g5736.t1